MFSLIALLAAAVAAPPTEWQRTLDHVVPAVVSLRVNTPRSFDDVTAKNSVATGFVVDAEQGLILTNRHVMGPGPAVAEAVFINNEEVALEAVYRDPVHDFAVFRFDPSALHFMDVSELELDPSGAEVGIDVRIVGNDAGEKISILGGTIARLDRDAPAYGRDRYNDFNTFYFQAASGTSGGSSGSPVVDAEGKVVALNAGARRKAASSYFLPLDRVVRALDLLRAGEPVPRGTIQTVFRHATYDEARRLGLPESQEAAARSNSPDASGLLVVRETVPGGPGDQRLRAGDVLLDVDGELIDGFVPLESALDTHVGGELSLRVQRGGATLTIPVSVGDLHAITPDSYLEVGGGVLNPLSYQQARNSAVPVQGVFLASTGYAFSSSGLPRGALITHVGDTPVPDLDAAEAALAALPDGARVPVRYRTLSDWRREQVAVLRMDRRWFPMRRCHWQPGVGWPCVDSAAPPKALPPPVRETTFPSTSDRPASALSQSLVSVAFTIPYRVAGVYGTAFAGTGVVVDADRGWVLVDRDTVPVALGDVRITFAGTVEVPGRVLWLHPEHNLAVVSYDPAAIGDTPVVSARFNGDPNAPGDRIWHVGLDSANRVVSRETTVERTDPLRLPLPSPPFFRDANLDVIEPVEAAASTGGVLVNRRGEVTALWASFVDLSRDRPDGYFRGLPAGYIIDAIDRLRDNDADPWPGVGFELTAISLASARDRGLPEADARRLEAAATRERRALVVHRIMAGSPAAEALREGDILISVSGFAAVDFSVIERAIRRGRVPVVVSRNGARVKLTLAPVALPGVEVERAIGWAGTLVHAPHTALATQRGLAPSGVYVAWYWYGSPAARHGLRPTVLITSINDTATPDLDAFAAAIAALPPGEAVRVTFLRLDGRVSVLTLKPDAEFWPTYQLSRDAQGWARTALPSQAGAAPPPG